jgi:hypothetical protein
MIAISGKILSVSDTTTANTCSKVFTDHTNDIENGYLDAINKRFFSFNSAYSVC